MVKSWPALEISQFLLTSPLFDVFIASPLHLFIALFGGLLRLGLVFSTHKMSKFVIYVAENFKTEVI